MSIDFDHIDNRDALSHKQPKIRPDVLEYGDLDGRTPVYLSDGRTVVYTKKKDPHEIERIRNFYEDLIRRSTKI